MNPWDIIGWAMIIATLLLMMVGAWVAYQVYVMPRWKTWRLWRRDRELQPKKGDVWIQNITTRIHIRQVYDDGVVSVQRVQREGGSYSADLSHDEWKAWRRERKLWKLSEDKPLTFVGWNEGKDKN